MRGRSGARKTGQGYRACKGTALAPWYAGGYNRVTEGTVEAVGVGCSPTQEHRRAGYERAASSAAQDGRLLTQREPPCRETGAEEVGLERSEVWSEGATV